MGGSNLKADVKAHEPIFPLGIPTPLVTAALAGGNPGSDIRGPGPKSKQEGVGAY